MSAGKQLLFASFNDHKLGEIRQMIPDTFTLLGLNDISFTEDIPEPFDTFEANAKAKASFVFQHTGLPCFADDSGLAVDLLNGKPGVLSARYAGEHKSSADNVAKLLYELGDSPLRKARFIAVIAYQKDKKDCFLFSGKVEGSISFRPLGNGGFGYDPIFIPSGFDQTFAQLSPFLKNQISHRALAMTQFLDFLRSD